MEKINKRAVGFEVQLKVREASEGGESRVIEGYALKFGVRSRLLLDWWVGVYYEILEPGCITRETLDACDIMLTMFHDRQLILGRSKNGVGTLHYEIDEIGVKFWCEMPKTVDGDKALELIARGDITGCSFIYSTDEKDSENAVSYEKTGEKTARALRDYQKSKGLHVNGVITDELLESLGVADQVSDAAKKEAKKAEYTSDYSYNTIARDADSYKGTKVRFRGKVLQEGDAGSSMRYIRLAVDSDYDTVLFVTYTSDQVPVRVLEDDILTIYGTVAGNYSYETVMGASITLPWVNSDMIDTSEVDMG